MTFIHVEPARDPGWSKDAAVRASETTRLSELLSRLLGDLAQLDAVQQPRLDYLDEEALDAVRSDPETYHLIGRAASSLEDAGERCVTAAYWREETPDEVEVELEVADDGVVWGPVPGAGAGWTTEPSPERDRRLPRGPHRASRAGVVAAFAEALPSIEPFRQLAGRRLGNRPDLRGLLGL